MSDSLVRNGTFVVAAYGHGNESDEIKAFSLSVQISIKQGNELTFSFTVTEDGDLPEPVLYVLMSIDVWARSGIMFLSFQYRITKFADGLPTFLESVPATD